MLLTMACILFAVIMFLLNLITEYFLFPPETSESDLFSLTVNKWLGLLNPGLQESNSKHGVPQGCTLGVRHTN